MKKLAGCAIAASCPAVYDPEDGSGNLVIVGRIAGAYPIEGVQTAPDEEAIVISRALIEEALKPKSV